MSLKITMQKNQLDTQDLNTIIKYGLMVMHVCVRLYVISSINMIHIIFVYYL